VESILKINDSIISTKGDRRNAQGIFDREWTKLK
jgi:hypothetical protein